MKNLITLIAALCFFNGFAQNRGEIQGTIIDSATSEPLPFANISLFQDSNLIFASTSDFDGNYSLKPIPEGSYHVLIEYAGYKSHKIDRVNVESDVTTIVNAELATLSSLDNKVQEIFGPISPRKEIKVRGIKKMNRDYTEFDQKKIDSTMVKNNESNTVIRCCRCESSYTFIDGVKVVNTNSTLKIVDPEVKVKVKAPGISAQFENADADPNHKRLMIQNAKSDNNIQYTNEYDKTIIIKTI